MRQGGGMEILNVPVQVDQRQDRAGAISIRYGLGIALDEGLVFASDSRTKAGVDSVSVFRKLRIFENPGERVVVVLISGNLAVSQSVVIQPEEGLEGSSKTLYDVSSMYDAMRLVGRALRNVYKIETDHLQAQDAKSGASFIVAGQNVGRWMRQSHVYGAGNLIEAGEDTPCLQTGEAKYGKPIHERVIRPDLKLLTAAKCALVSFGSTIRSNVSVTASINFEIYKHDYLHVATQ